MGGPSTGSRPPIDSVQVAGLTAGRTTVGLEVDGVCLQALVDTGSDLTLVSKAAAKRLDLGPLKTKTALMADGHTQLKFHKRAHLWKECARVCGPHGK